MLKKIYAENIAAAMELKNLGVNDLVISIVTGVNGYHILNAKKYGFDEYPSQVVETPKKQRRYLRI